MKFAIPTDQGFVFHHFGRYPTYTIVELENGAVIKLEEITHK